MLSYLTACRRHFYEKLHRRSPLHYTLVHLHDQRYVIDLILFFLMYRLTKTYYGLLFVGDKTIGIMTNFVLKYSIAIYRALIASGNHFIK